jgi:hypothetical protein
MFWKNLIFIAILQVLGMCSSLPVKKVHFSYPTELLPPVTGSDFSAVVTQDVLTCFGNRDYSSPTYIETLYCMLPYFPGTMQYCHSVWGSRSAVVEVVGSVEFIKIPRLPVESSMSFGSKNTYNANGYLTNINHEHSVLHGTRWLHVTSTNGLSQHHVHSEDVRESGYPAMRRTANASGVISHQSHSTTITAAAAAESVLPAREIIQIPAEPYFLCARSTDWQGTHSRFTIKFRPAYLRAKDKRYCNDQTLVHIVLIIAVSSVWLIPYLAAVLSALVAFEHGLKVMVTCYLLCALVVCLTPVMLTKHNKAVAQQYISYFLTRIQAADARIEIRKRLPVLHAMFFSSVVVFAGFNVIYAAYYYDLVLRETRNTLFKTVISIAASWCVFSVCRSFERFVKNWAWIAMAVALGQTLESHLNPLCRNEVIFATMFMSFVVRTLLWRALPHKSINKLIGDALPHIHFVTSKYWIPLPYQIYEHHSLQHLKNTPHKRSYNQFPVVLDVSRSGSANHLHTAAFSATRVELLSSSENLQQQQQQQQQQPHSGKSGTSSSGKSTESGGKQVFLTGEHQKSESFTSTGASAAGLDLDDLLLHSPRSLHGGQGQSDSFGGAAMAGTGGSQWSGNRSGEYDNGSDDDDDSGGEEEEEQVISWRADDVNPEEGEEEVSVRRAYAQDSAALDSDYEDEEEGSSSSDEEDDGDEVKEEDEGNITMFSEDNKAKPSDPFFQGDTAGSDAGAEFGDLTAVDALSVPIFEVGPFTCLVRSDGEAANDLAVAADGSTKISGINSFPDKEESGNAEILVRIPVATRDIAAARAVHIFATESFGAAISGSPVEVASFQPLQETFALSTTFYCSASHMHETVLTKLYLWINGKNAASSDMFSREFNALLHEVVLCRFHNTFCNPNVEVRCQFQHKGGLCLTLRFSNSAGINLIPTVEYVRRRFHKLIRTILHLLGNKVCIASPVLVNGSSFSWLEGSQAKRHNGSFEPTYVLDNSLIVCLQHTTVSFVFNAQKFGGVKKVLAKHKRCQDKVVQFQKRYQYMLSMLRGALYAAETGHLEVYLPLLLHNSSCTMHAVRDASHESCDIPHMVGSASTTGCEKNQNGCSLLAVEVVVPAVASFINSETFAAASDTETHTTGISITGITNAASNAKERLYTCSHVTMASFVALLYVSYCVDTKATR